MESKAKMNIIFEDATKVITNPVGFYRDMLKTGGFADPVIFLLVMAAIMGLLIAVFSLFGAGVIGAMAAGFGAIIFMPIFALIGSFIGAAILFVIWKLMGSEQSYETAYRCVAYAAAIYPITAVLGLIPYIGTIVGIAWGMYLIIVASSEVHQLQRRSAYTVFGTLGAIIIVMNIGTEIATRRMASQVEGWQQQFETFGKQIGQPGDRTPEEAGKAVGDFLKGIESAVQDANKDADAESSVNSLSEPASSDNDGYDGDSLSPEQAGKALGDFFKGFNEATKDLAKQQQSSQAVDAGSVSSSSADGAAETSD